MMKDVKKDKPVRINDERKKIKAVTTFFSRLHFQILRNRTPPIIPLFFHGGCEFYGSVSSVNDNHKYPRT